MKEKSGNNQVLPTFEGFVLPETNYFRVPHQFLDVMSKIKSLTVLKLVLYVMRHTWGYNGEEGIPKQISVDEFCNGRKRKNGTRIDGGTGLSRSGVHSGLNEAVTMNLLRVREDRRDLGRIKRYYSLVTSATANERTANSERSSESTSPDLGVQSLNARVHTLDDSPQFRDPNFVPGGSNFVPGGSNFVPRGSNFVPRGSNFVPRTEKETFRKKPLERNLKELKTLSEGKPSDQTSSFDEPSLDEEQQPSLDEQQRSSKSNGSPRKKKKQPSTFDKRAADAFASVIGSYRKVQKNSDLRQWAQVFRQMREVDGVSKRDIRETIEWYGKHIGEEFVPEAYSASSFRRKFADGKFASAMRRSARNESSPVASNGQRITRENMWDVPGNLLPSGLLKVEVGYDGRQYDGRTLSEIRRRLSERSVEGLPLAEELKPVLEELGLRAEDFPPTIIGRIRG